MRLTTTITLLACVAIAGCRETASCAEGQYYDRDQRACRTGTPSDSGIDAPNDAGDFCDSCADRALCDRENLECDECVRGATPTTCTGDRPVCDATGHCVQCEEDVDCPDPDASHCVDAQCTPCALDAECGHVVDGTTMLDVCDTARAPATCVECLEATEELYCYRDSMPYGCDRTTGRCAETPRSRDTCDACTHDYECIRGRRCIDLEVAGASVGTFCLLERSATQECGDTSAVFQPYSHPRAATSVDGADGTFCFPPPDTSCQTLLDYNSRPCDSDDDCGLPGVADGDCPPIGGRCSYTCGGDLDCSASSNCAASAPRYCRPDV